MKKKVSVAVLGLSLVLAACVNGQDAVQQTSSSQASAEMSSCEHDWQEATYEQPKTCALCGETEGEKKQDYFTEQGVSVAQTQPRIGQPLQYVSFLADYPDVQVAHSDGTFTIETATTPAKEEGKNIVTVTVTHNMPVFSDDSTDGDFEIVFADAFFDLYNGEVIIREEELATGNTPADEEYAFVRNVTVDGKEIELRFNAVETWSNTGWFVNDQAADEDDYTCMRTYEFLLPADYDGLVYASLPMSEYAPAKQQVSGTKAADIIGAGQLKQTTLIRVLQ